MTDTTLCLFEAHAALLDHTIESHAYRCFHSNDVVEAEGNAINDFGKQRHIMNDNVRRGAGLFLLSGKSIYEWMFDGIQPFPCAWPGMSAENMVGHPSTIQRTVNQQCFRPKNLGDFGKSLSPGLNNPMRQCIIVNDYRPQFGKTR
ncbi:hypothetical protein Tam1G_0447 [Bifidobacterium imperatoris]|uniref:Uncharacterized protein n=1 Tax=Bifidobacterium imperatoris TaxID=2020965 RepID=A0A2N5IUH6_9BIFI|nr:hypothetical protein Tam1G_0447 [Bifidobacterium imperatoris]